MHIAQWAWMKKNIEQNYFHCRNHVYIVLISLRTIKNETKTLKNKLSSVRKRVLPVVWTLLQTFCCCVIRLLYNSVFHFIHNLSLQNEDIFWVAEFVYLVTIMYYILHSEIVSPNSVPFCNIIYLYPSLKIYENESLLGGLWRSSCSIDRSIQKSQRKLWCVCSFTGKGVDRVHLIGLNPRTNLQ